MTIVVIALAVLLVASLVALVMSRSALGAARSESDALRDQVEKATVATERAEADAAQQRNQAEKSATRAKTAEAERDTARREVDRVAAQRTETESRLAAADQRLAEVADEAEQARVQAEDALARAREADAGRSDALAALALVRDELAQAKGGLPVARADDGPATVNADDTTSGALPMPGLDPLGVWALESVRLDRLWRDQLAIGGDAASPFAIHEDPTRAAVQILVDALRESSGTPVELTWHVTSMIPPAPGARVVRAVEELLAHARSADSAELSVTMSGNDIVLSLHTEPDLVLPDHLVAALRAAGLDVEPDDAGRASATRIPWPADTLTWEG